MKALLRKFGLALGLAGSVMFLASCGGSGAGAGGAGSKSTGTTSALTASTPTQLTLTADSLTMNSDGKQTVTITATTKNASNVVLKGAIVSFSTTDPGASLAPADTKTDDAGTLLVALKTNDKTTRTIRVNAVSEGLTASIDIAVAGTTLSINGPTGIGFNASANYTVVLKDSAGTPISGQLVKLTSQNTVTVAPGVTDTQGQAKFVLTGSKSGTDPITVTAMGASAGLSVAVTATQLNFETPLPLTEYPVGASQPGNIVTLRFLNNGVAVVGTPVSLSTTRGAVTAASGAAGTSFVTGSDGRVSFRVQSVNAGLATLTATAGSVIVSQTIEFVASVPTQISLQAGPSVVGVNLTAASSNSSQLVARVTDGDNPVKGVRVDFAAIADPSAGRIEPAFAITDSYGRATASFISGAIPSGTDLVKIKASLPDWPSIASSTAKLTVAQQEISIRIGESNLVELDENHSKYIKPFTVLVTDNAGRPISGAKVSVSVQSITYYKGWWDKDTVQWFPVRTAGCASEDINFNGLLDPSEDDRLVGGGYGNGDGTLTPGNVSTISVIGTTDLTGADGFATLHLAYPKVYAPWTGVEITVSILAPSGTEAKTRAVHTLQVVKDDLTALSAAPPGRVWPPVVDPSTGTITSPGYNGSPYGIAADCRNPL